MPQNTELSEIKVDSPEYKKLSLNNKTRVFNREVHAFEKDQKGEILQYTVEIEDLLNSDHGLSKEREGRLLHIFAKLRPNLHGLLEAESVYEAELYHNSIIDLIKESMMPQWPFEWEPLLHLTYDDSNIIDKLDHMVQNLEKTRDLYLRLELPVGHQFVQALEQCHALKAMYPSMNAETKNKELPDKELFDTKKMALIDNLVGKYEQVSEETKAERSVDFCLTRIEQHTNALFRARSSYLEDDRGIVHKITEGVEASWLTAGLIVAVVPIIAVAFIAPPFAIFGIGVAVAAYCAVDFSKTAGITVAKEISSYAHVKIGEKPSPKSKSKKRSKLYRSKQFSSFLKKAIPLGLCGIAVAAGITAVFVTEGVLVPFLLGAGVVAAVGAVGVMAVNKIAERKKINKVKKHHKRINKKDVRQVNIKRENHNQVQEQAQKQDQTKSKDKLEKVLQLVQTPAPKPHGIKSKLHDPLEKELRETLTQYAQVQSHQHHFEDSMDETFSLLSGHPLEKGDLINIENQAKNPKVLSENHYDGQLEIDLDSNKITAKPIPMSTPIPESSVEVEESGKVEQTSNQTSETSSITKKSSKNESLPEEDEDEGGSASETP